MKCKGACFCHGVGALTPKFSNPSAPLSSKILRSSGLIVGAKCFSVLSNDVWAIASVSIVGEVLGRDFSFFWRGVIVDIFIKANLGKLDC